MPFMQITGLSAHSVGAVLRVGPQFGVIASPTRYAPSPSRLFSDLARARLSRPDRGVPPPRSGPYPLANLCIAGVTEQSPGGWR